MGKLDLSEGPMKEEWFGSLVFPKDSSLSLHLSLSLALRILSSLASIPISKFMSLVWKTSEYKAVVLPPYASTFWLVYPPKKVSVLMGYPFEAIYFSFLRFSLISTTHTHKSFEEVCKVFQRGVVFSA